MNTRFLMVSAALLFGFPLTSAAVVIYTLDFDGEGTYTTTGSNSGGSYFFGESTIGSGPLTGFSGGGVASGKAFATRDLNGSSRGSVVNEHTLTVTGFDTTGYTNLNLEISLAASTGIWEDNDYLNIVANGSELDSFTGDDGDDPLSSGSADLNKTFQKLTYSLDTSLTELLVTLNSTYRNEIIAIDNIVIQGDRARVKVLQRSVPEPSVLALLGIGLAGIGFARKKQRIGK